jgi:PAS domain S-box-containing protein
MKKHNIKSTDASILIQKAVELLKKKNVKTGPKPSDTEVQDLISELETYRKELEFRNVRPLKNARPVRNDPGAAISSVVGVNDITERKQAERDLKESELKYRELVENSPDAIVIYIDGKIVFTNNECNRLIGASNPTELIGKSVMQFVHPDYRAVVMERMKKMENQDSVLPLVEEKFVLPDGSEIDAEVKAMPIRFDNKAAVLLIIRDITKRKMEESMLKESLVEAQRFRQALDHVSAFIYMKDTQSRYFYANQPTLELFGCSAEELVGCDDNHFFPSDTAKRLQEIDKRVFKGEKTTEEIDISSAEVAHRVYLEVKTPIYTEHQNKTVSGLLGISTDITERKQEEDALQNSLSLTKAAIESIHNGILVVSQQGTVILTNAKFAEMWHIPDDIISSGDDKTLLDFIFGQLADPDGFKAKIAELYSHPEAESQDLIYFRDGRIFERISKPMFVRDVPKGRVWSFFDITERKQAEEALKESEEQFRTIVENMGEGFGFVDTRERFVFANKAAEEIFGLGSGGLVGKNLAQMIPAEQFRLIQKESSRRAQGRKSIYELEILRPNHEKRNIIVTAVPHFNKEGVFVGTYGVFRDITEQKQLEDAHNNERTLFRTVIDLIPDAVYVKDSGGRKIIANPKEVQLSGKNSEDEVIGKTDFNLYTDIEAKNALAQEQLIFDTGKPLFWDEGTLIDKNGKLHCTSASKVPFFDTHGKIIGIVGVTHDITEQKQAELKIQQQNKELIKLNDDKDLLMSILGHDLKSPFNSILGLSELLIENFHKYDNVKIENLINYINKSAHNAYNLLEDLLLWTHSQSGKIPFEPQKLNFIDICQEVLEIHKPNAIAKEITVNHSATEGITVFADINMLKTILRNLVSNAIKFTRPGGKINIFAQKNNKIVTISVSDNGIGIAPERINKLFSISKTITTKGTEDESGTGLGLLLCKEFVEKHGGKIWVESELEKGSTFKFSIPT